MKELCGVCQYSEAIKNQGNGNSWLIVQMKLNLFIRGSDLCPRGECEEKPINFKFLPFAVYIPSAILSQYLHKMKLFIDEAITRPL